MGLGAEFPNPNDKIVKKLMLDFARNSEKKSEESVDSTVSSQPENNTGDSLTVVREMDDGYMVRITQTDKETGEKSERTDFMARELFESCVKTGYLKKL